MAAGRTRASGPLKGSNPKSVSTTWGSGSSTDSGLMAILHNTVFPLFLMTACPSTIIFTWLICTKYDGSVLQFAQEVTLDRLRAEWPSPSFEAAQLIVVYAVFSVFLLAVLPGKKFLGPVTRTGYQPSYTLNGVAAYVVTHAALGLLYWAGYPLGTVYDQFGQILQTLSVFSFGVCFLLYLKGLYAPSSADSGSTGNVIMDFFWGTELYPEIAGFSCKQIANCRLAMMGWPVLIVLFAVKQQELYGSVSNSMLVSVLIQEIYVLKFFYWESGYFHTMDIMYDRFGFYIFWGVSCWVPGIYTLVSLYMVNHPHNLSTEVAVAIFLFGVFNTWANYDADIQRQNLRASGGKTTVWGKPPKFVLAKYQTSDGKEITSLLLASGWWGISRHIHYVPEILLSLAWTLPAGTTHILPYFYVVYLTILLLHRLGRDEIRCSDKYGVYWEKYCQMVPYRIIPYIY